MQLFFAFLITCFVSACSNDDGSPKQIELAGGTSTEQTVYADQTHTDGGIRFTAQAAWTATVSDITGSRTDMPVKPDWLTLSAYSGGAGEQALALTLKENLTGHDRKALITITCGDTAITIIVEQKAVKADGSQPTSPITPPDNYDKLITKIVEHEYYTSGSSISDDEIIYEFFYDGSKRLIKIVQTEEEDVTTVNFTYGTNQISCELTRTENGVLNKDDFYKATVALDEAMRIVSGEYIDTDSKGGDNVYQYKTTYTLSYDANGYLVKSNRIEEGEDATEERITWIGGNPTQVWWGTNGGKDLIDKATYGKVANNTNIDLNWLIALDSEGWDFAAGDSYKTFAIMGYVGKRSANLAETMTDASEAWNGTAVVTNYTYQLGNDGTPTTIKKEAKHGDSFTESGTYTITYNK